MKQYLTLVILTAMPIFLYAQLGSIKVKKPLSKKNNKVEAPVSNKQSNTENNPVYIQLDSSIISFDALWIKNGAYATYNVKGNRLPAFIVKPGSKIYIENIKALGPDGSIRRLRGFTLKERK
ncbi:MAG: hypothetical protein ACT4ON_08425 [Bacteroidota bacterium]